MKKLLAVLTVVFTSGMMAQKYEIGKVSVAELQQKTHPADTSAVAAILFEKGTVSFDYTAEDGFVMITVVQSRIKIFKKEGYDWANHQVKYYIGHGSQEEIDFSNVATYNLVNGKIERTKLKSDGEFDENINKYWAVKKITMPNIKEGSVLEFEYKIKSKNFTEMHPWSFQSSIPVDYSEYRTEIPEYFTYNALQRGYLFPKVKKVNQARTISVTTREKAEKINQPRGLTTNEIKFMEAQTTYIAQSLPAMRDEAYVNNIANYTSGITHELSMIQYPQEAAKAYSTDWNTVTNKIYEDSDFGAELSKTDYFEQDLKSEIAGLTDKTIIANAIFNYVKSNIKWNDLSGYSCHDGVKNAYKTKTGNVAEINLMLTAMLRHAGITANPVLVSTRANGIALFPNRTAFNYVISAVETPGGLLLMDATDKFSTPNVLPLRVLNWSGRLIREDGTSSEIDLVPQKASRKTTSIQMLPQPDGTVTGQIRMQFTDQYALEFRRNFVGANQDTYIDDLQNKNKGVEVAGYKRENDLDPSKPLSETYSFTDRNSIEIIGDRMYISPLLFFAEDVNPFRQETREYPIDFSYPQQRKFSVNIDVPQGYVVETLPKSVSLGTEENQTAFRYNIALTGNKIQLSVTSDINLAVFPAEYYAGLKDYFQQMINKQSEKIILKKV
ncbi:MAG TPA: DUF3857 domain-containing protein [Flavobacterium sp.]